MKHIFFLWSIQLLRGFFIWKKLNFWCSNFVRKQTGNKTRKIRSKEDYPYNENPTPSSHFNGLYNIRNYGFATIHSHQSIIQYEIILQKKKKNWIEVKWFRNMYNMRTCMSITRRAVWFHSELAMLILAKIFAADNLDTGTEIRVGFCYSSFLG